MSEDLQLDPPFDDRGALGGLGVGQGGEVAIRERGDEGVEIRVFEDVGVRVGPVQAGERSVGRLQRVDLLGVPGEATFEVTHCCRGLITGQAMVAVRVENRVGALEELIHTQPDGLGRTDVRPERVGRRRRSATTREHEQEAEHGRHQDRAPTTRPLTPRRAGASPIPPK